MPDPVKCRNCDGPAVLRGESPFLCRPCGDRLAALCRRVNGGRPPSERPRVSARYTTSTKVARGSKSPPAAGDHP